MDRRAELGLVVLGALMLAARLAHAHHDRVDLVIIGVIAGLTWGVALGVVVGAVTAIVVKLRGGRSPLRTGAKIGGAIALAVLVGLVGLSIIRGC